MSQTWNFKKLILEEIQKKGGWVNTHVHADRAFTMNPDKLDIYKNHDLVEKWDIIDEVKQNASVDEYYGRFCNAFDVMVEQGVSVVGSFIDCDTVCEDRALKGALKAIAKYKGSLEIKLMNQPIKGLATKDQRYWFEYAADHVDIIGGLPRRDQVYHGKGEEHLDFILEMGKKLDKMVHVHVDQFNTVEDKETELLAKKTIFHGMQGRVAGVHGISIAAHSKEYRQYVYNLMKEADLMMISCPFAWIDASRSETLQPFHNALTPVDEMVKEGITVAIGTDNICDYMLPFNDGDMWPELRLMAQGNRFLEIDDLVNIATTNGRKVLGLETLKEEKVEVMEEVMEKVVA